MRHKEKSCGRKKQLNKYTRRVAAAVCVLSTITKLPPGREEITLSLKAKRSKVKRKEGRKEERGVKGGTKQERSRLELKVCIE